MDHLDELEAEAIYIMREVAAQCEAGDALFHRKRFFRYAAPCIESILSGETAISILTCKYYMEIQRNDCVS